MNKLIFALLVVIGLGVSAPADARGGGRFGTEDKIYRIETIQISPELAAEMPPAWSNGVMLARRATIQWFVLGAWLTDVEYVAVPAGGGETYWSLNEEQMTALHEIGAISSATPAYSIPTIDYVFGYSLWIAIGAFALYLFGSAMVTNARASGVRQAVGDDYGAFVRMALLNAAKEDGDIADEELKLIGEVLKGAFNMETTRLQLIEEAAGSDLNSGQLVAHFKMAQSAMTADQRALLIRALVALFAADGQWTSKEKQLLQRYVVALGTEPKNAEKLVRDLAQGPSGAPA